LHLGYRKGLRGGKWVLRRYLGGEKYIVESIGTADDHGKANGADILDFFQAQKQARELAAKATAPAGAGVFTVADAMNAYFDRLEHKGSKSLTGSRGRSSNHIISQLGDVAVSALTQDMLEASLERLVAMTPSAPARLPRIVSWPF